MVSQRKAYQKGMFLWWLTGVHACVVARLGVALATAPIEPLRFAKHVERPRTRKD